VPGVPTGSRPARQEVTVVGKHRDEAGVVHAVISVSAAGFDVQYACCRRVCPCPQGNDGDQNKREIAEAASTDVDCLWCLAEEET
jgi:hypothetical protein